MKPLIRIVLQQGPGDAIVRGVMQQHALPWLVWGRARAQSAAAAQPKSELQVPAWNQSQSHGMKESV